MKGRVPALDGLRGVAIALVVAYHLQWLPGGWVGVNVFFVLSGFLITSLLLGEQTKTGTIRLKAFYWRRCVRLLPALLVALAVIWLLWSAAGQGSIAGPRLLPVLFYVSNVVLALRPGWIVTGWSWSLSLEEQFYALWPPLLRRALRKGVTLQRLARVLLATAGLMMLARYLIGSHTAFHVGYALLRGDELMLGAVLAMVPWTAPRWVTGVSLGALGYVAITHSLDHVPWTVTVGTLGAVGLLASRDRLSPVLTLAPLRYLGRISYALYLWDGILVNAPLPLSGPHGASVSIAVIAFAMAVLSTHLLEEPLRRRLRDREVVEPHAAGVVPQAVLGGGLVEGVRDPAADVRAAVLLDDDRRPREHDGHHVPGREGRPATADVGDRPGLGLVDVEAGAVRVDEQVVVRIGGAKGDPTPGVRRP
jgi:peptidoglycan/LPS O-acetylase OafA/YrhL